MMTIDISTFWIIIATIGSIIATLIGVIWNQRNGMLKDIKDAINTLTYTLSKQAETNDKKHGEMWVAIRETETKVSKIEGQLGKGIKV